MLNLLIQIGGERERERESWLENYVVFEKELQELYMITILNIPLVKKHLLIFFYLQTIDELIVKAVPANILMDRELNLDEPLGTYMTTWLNY